MGMIQTIIKSCKPEADRNAFESSLVSRARILKEQGDADGDRPEDANVVRLTAENFDEHWANQDNLRDGVDVKEEYRQKAIDGRAWAIEVNW